MTYLLGVLVVSIGIAVSIALHELGHLVPAKAFGVKCKHYMIGFGPTLWQRQIGDTAYGVKAIPLGGSVRMIGMFPPKPGQADTAAPSSSAGRWGALIEEARNQSQQEVEPGDEDRVFYKLSTGRKLLVMLGGPLMNLVLATLILAGIVMIHGQPVPVDGVSVNTVSQCVRSVSGDPGAAQQPCTAADTPAPAAAAGLRPGDQILTIAGVPIRRQGDIAATIRPRAGQAVPFTIRRDGTETTLTLRPIATTLPRYDQDGAPLRDAQGTILTERAGFVGITTRQHSALERQPITAVPAIVGQGVAGTAGVVVGLPLRVVDVVKAVIGVQERDVNGPISIVGVGRVAGEVADGRFAGIDTPAAIVVTLLSLVASLNIALFVFNLIPLMPLDGGHIAGALWEGLKRGVARVTGRPDPGYVDVAKAMPLAYAMSVVLIAVSALLIYADFVKPVKL